MSNSCGICKSDNTSGGSWTPTRCMNCGAMEAPGCWYYDKDSRPTVAEIREKSGYGKKKKKSTDL